MKKYQFVVGDRVVDSITGFVYVVVFIDTRIDRMVCKRSTSNGETTKIMTLDGRSYKNESVTLEQVQLTPTVRRTVMVLGSGAKVKNRYEQFDLIKELESYQFRIHGKLLKDGRVFYFGEHLKRFVIETEFYGLDKVWGLSLGDVYDFFSDEVFGKITVLVEIPKN